MKAITIVMGKWKKLFKKKRSKKPVKKKRKR